LNGDKYFARKVGFNLSYVPMDSRWMPCSQTFASPLSLCLGVWREGKWRVFGVGNIGENEEFFHIF